MESVVRVWTAGPKEPGGKQEPVQPRLAAESLPGWAGGREAGGREALGPRDPQGEQRRRGRWDGACPGCSGRGGQCLGLRGTNSPWPEGGGRPTWLAHSLSAPQPPGPESPRLYPHPLPGSWVPWGLSPWVGMGACGPVSVEDQAQAPWIPGLPCTSKCSELDSQPLWRSRAPECCFQGSGVPIRVSSCPLGQDGGQCVPARPGLGLAVV